MPKYFLLFTLALSVWAYFPALGGGFAFDDDFNISANDLLKIEQFSFEDLLQASMSSDAGPLKRPVAMFTFAINHVLTGMDTWWMKLTNLLIHLFNGLLVLLVTRQLYRRCPNDNSPRPIIIPYFIMAIWLVHPINVTAVSYIVQRMTSLSATFVLLAIYCYLKLRQGKLTDWRRYLLSISILVLWLLGMLTKEIAILLSIYIFAIEWCLYGFKSASKSERKHLVVLWTLLAVPWVFAFLYSIYDSSFLLAHYKGRDFSPSERMYTELRVMIDYLRYALIPDIRYMGLFHDNYVISQSLFTPVTTLLSLLSITGLLVLAIRVKNVAPLFCLGILWFFGGHVLESTIYPLEIKFFHRNYLPCIGILLAATEVGLRLHRNYRSITTILALLILLGFSISTRFLNHQWSADFRMQIMEAINNPDSKRANFNAAEVAVFYAVNAITEKERTEYRTLAIEFFEKFRLIDSRSISGEMGILEAYSWTNEEPPQQLIEDLIQNLPTAKVELSMILLFESYMECLVAEKRNPGRCLLKAKDFERIKKALLSNNEMQAATKERILVIYAKYLDEYQGDTAAAIAAQVDALVEYPTLRDFMLLSQYYEKGGYYKLMTRTNNMLEELDRLGTFRKFIRESRERMSNRSHTE